MRRARALVIPPEAHDLGLVLLLVRGKSHLADKERLPQLDITAKSRLGRIEIHRAAKFMAVERQTGLSAQTVPRRQPTGNRPTVDQVFKELRRFIRMDE